MNKTKQMTSEEKKEPLLKAVKPKQKKKAVKPKQKKSQVVEYSLKVRGRWTRQRGELVKPNLLTVLVTAPDGATIKRHREKHGVKLL